MIEIRVPASSANLGPGFDCFGLALQLHLTVRAEPSSEGWNIKIEGEGADQLPTDEKNLIARVVVSTAESEGLVLPAMKLHVKNEIPLARGLGSSAAAIAAGIGIVEAVLEREFDTDKFLQYALRFENHADNLTAARLGGFTLACASSSGRLFTKKLKWPAELKAIAVIPDFLLDTESARAALPASYSRADAVFNLQHALMFQASIANCDFELIREALEDRFHQPYRASLIPGLKQALDVRLPGLLGVALSGSGPTLLALATENFDTIGGALQGAFASRGISAKARVLDIDHEGRIICRREHREH